MVAILTFVAVKFLDRLRRRKTRIRSQQIIRQAEQEMENRRREVELEMKELAIQRKAEGEMELRQLREEFHERDRSLDKRQDAQEQQAEQLRKQEKIVEATQRKLSEKIQDANRRREEVTKLLDHPAADLARNERPEPARRPRSGFSNCWKRNFSKRPARPSPSTGTAA